MAKQQGVSVADVAEGGPGLVFVAYPKALSLMPAAPMWSVFFFLMIVFVGLDSEVNKRLSQSRLLLKSDH